MWISLLNELHNIKIGPRKLNVQVSIKRIGSTNIIECIGYTRLTMLFIAILPVKVEFPAMLNNAKNAEQRWEC